MGIGIHCKKSRKERNQRNDESVPTERHMLKNKQEVRPDFEKEKGYRVTPRQVFLFFFFFDGLIC